MRSRRLCVEGVCESGSRDPFRSAQLRPYATVDNMYRTIINDYHEQKWTKQTNTTGIHGLMNGLNQYHGNKRTE